MFIVGKKLTYSEVNEYIESFNYKLISNEYKNANGTLVIQCDKGHIFEMKWSSFQQGRRCTVCNGGIKLTYDQIRNEINISGCLLLSESYVNSSTKLKIKCKCGNIFYKTYNEFNSQNQKQCPECGIKLRSENQKLTYEYVKSYLQNEGYEILQDYFINTSTKIKIKCSNGHEYFVKFNTFKNGNRCGECCGNQKYTIEEVSLYMDSLGFKLLSKKYINNKEKLFIQCPEGHIFESTFTHFKNSHSCKICSLNGRSGENHYSWKGGIKPIYNYLRSKLYEWKKESIKNCNNKCIITGIEDHIDIHHLYGFDLILDELLELTKIPLKSTIGEYSNKELEILEENCIRLHYKYPLGVCLTDEMHDEFHKIYGYGKNTPEQFYEFYRMKTGKEYNQQPLNNAI
jgi:hypothetical protein